jgi:hypothetical protein
MIRPVFIEVALFMTPFAVYALYLWATRVGIFEADAWPLPVLGWLTAIAVALMVSSFFLIAHFSGAPPGSTYVPAHMENGRLVPGSTR